MKLNEYLSLDEVQPYPHPRGEGTVWIARGTYERYGGLIGSMLAKTYATAELACIENANISVTDYRNASGRGDLYGPVIWDRPINHSQVVWVLTHLRHVLRIIRAYRGGLYAIHRIPNGFSSGEREPIFEFVNGLKGRAAELAPRTGPLVPLIRRLGGEKGREALRRIQEWDFIPALEH